MIAWQPSCLTWSDLSKEGLPYIIKHPSFPSMCFRVGYCVFEVLLRICWLFWWTVLCRRVQITSQMPNHPANSFFYPRLKELPPIASIKITRQHRSSDRQTLMSNHILPNSISPHRFSGKTTGLSSSVVSTHFIQSDWKWKQMVRKNQCAWGEVKHTYVFFHSQVKKKKSKSSLKKKMKRLYVTEYNKGNHLVLTKS